ncbi:tyrosine-type recombinase/integrase [Pararcticibacter amylolyticus]|uniref:Integrase n=1 Tax=Pararcticibacter amylolyticus TaxID=2173175 RepID=A0A2U2PCJ4_9SPHI|nr:tyrosine-type recombinase/integrase [Pararcticibacter amylolyticus]PWG79107.1 integrase [Pararcticibacter amylolyticus]
MFIERFTNYLQYEKRYSEHTVKAYLKDLKQFEDFLKDQGTDLSLAQTRDVRAWVVGLMELTGARSVNRKLSSLRSFYKFLNREKLLTPNPLLPIRALKTPKSLPAVVPDSGLDYLLDHGGVFSNDFAGLRDKLIIEFLFGTGVRLAEMLVVKESDIDFDRQMIRIFGKRGKERIVPVNVTLEKLLKEYIYEKNLQNFENDSVALIVTDGGKPAYPKLVYRVVRRYLACITTAEKRSPHILRHSFATSLLNKGADLNAIKELLGHANLAATQIYTHNSVERLKSIYKQAHPKA